MKHIFLTYLLLAVFGSLSADAQSKKVQDDIYYTAEDAKRDAEAAEKERQAMEEARAKRAAEREANGNTAGYESGDEEYIDYDDDDYYYTNRFNRFNGPYVGASYWAYDPFFWSNPWYGGGFNAWGWGPSWGVGVGFGGPYWSSYWGWNSWYGYPGFYSAWNSPWMYGGGWGGYYNGFYDGYYAGAYGGVAGGGNVRTVTYGPRSSINRYPGSLRATGTRTGTGTSGGTRGQLRRSSVGELREAPNNRNYSRSSAPLSSPGA
ncbi:MAG TPA: cell envelope integrity protein TolA, partial [Flavipsychrobacter sp.]